MIDPEKFTEVYESVTNQQIARTPTGMAHWSGTGPAGSTCRQCAHWRVQGRYGKSPKDRQPYELKDGPCALYEKRVSIKGKMGPKLRHTQPSCKYFEENASPPKITEKPF